MTAKLEKPQNTETKEASETGGNVLSFFKKIEADIVKWFIGTICTIICIAIPFYFNTTSSIEAHSTKINTIQTEVGSLKQNVITLEKNPGVNGDQVIAIKKIVEEIQSRQQRLEQRQDKMYDLMLEIAKAK